MKIILREGKRILIQDDGKEVDISDMSIIEYTGIYYSNRTEFDHNVEETEKLFIGIVECERSRYDEGIQGIYLRPMYLWNQEIKKWQRIANYTPPSSKYFLYPHLLMLPEQYYHYRPLYFLHTCKAWNREEYDDLQEVYCRETCFLD